MDHQNITQFTRHMSDMVAAQQNYGYLPPEPCVFYPTNTTPPNIQSLVPVLQNGCNFSYICMPKWHEGGLHFGMSHLNGAMSQHPPTTLDLTVPAPSGHYIPYLAPGSCIRDFPLQVTHGSIPASSYIRNMPYIDAVRGAFKRKNTEEGIQIHYQYHNTAVGPSSSILPAIAMPAETNFTSLDTSSIEYGGYEPASMAESASHRPLRNQPNVIGAEPVLVQKTSHLILANYNAPLIQMPGMSYCNNADVLWRPVPLPYLHGCIDTGNVAFQGFEANTHGFHPPLHLIHPNPLQPPLSLQSGRGYSNLHASRMLPSGQLSAVDSGTMFMAPSGFQLYQPQGREAITDSSAELRDTPHFRVLPEDEIAMLEVPEYHEVRDSVDHHRDMRLDIDHMSYEELLALGDQIGRVGTGLSEEFIRNNLKTRTFTPSAAQLNLEESVCTDHQIDFCVICQSNYEDKEAIGRADCGHEYHTNCLKKWLLIENTCPICKSTALGASKDKNL